MSSPDCPKVTQEDPDRSSLLWRVGSENVLVWVERDLFAWQACVFFLHVSWIRDVEKLERNVVAVRLRFKILWVLSINTLYAIWVRCGCDKSKQNRTILPKLYERPNTNQNRTLIHQFRFWLYRNRNLFLGFGFNRTIRSKLWLVWTLLI